MAKTRRDIAAIMSSLDIIIEVIDARIPLSSRIPDLDKLTNSTTRILVFNKYDLCDKTETNKWIDKYKKDGYIVVTSDSKNTNDYKKVIESIQVKMRKNINSEKTFTSKKTNRGRKPKLDEELRKHSKFSDDNILQKIKNICLNYFLKYINLKLLDLFKSDNSDDLNNKKLYILSKNQDGNSKSEKNKTLLNMTMQSIFSQNISTKYKSSDSNHNKNLIEELINEQDEEKRLFFQKTFNLSFLDVLKHFRGSIYIKELSGMTLFRDYVNKNVFGKNSKEYKEILSIFMNNYETIVMEKHSREKKKKIIK
jgi:ribosome biogenesis GTPase A